MPFRAPLVLALLVSLSESSLDSLSLRRRSDIGKFGEGEREGGRPPKPPPEEPGIEKSKSDRKSGKKFNHPEKSELLSVNNPHSSRGSAACWGQSMNPLEVICAHGRSK